MKRRTSSSGSNTGGSPRSDRGIMASGSADAAAAPESSSDASEECPAGKKKSRFQTFKDFFAKKKRKEAAGPVAESEDQLKSSHSIEDVNTPELTSVHTDKDSDSGSNIKVGSKALSKDSVFTSDPPSPETNEALQSSHDSIHGKVKSLQLQLKQAIRLGSPPAVISMKKSEDGGVVSEDDGLPCSPPEYSTIHTVHTTSSQRSSGVIQRSGSLSPEGSDSDDDQMSEASSRPGSPQISIPVDFSEPASSLSCLDSSAAQHRIAVKSRACAKRKPASRDLQSKRRDLRERLLLRDTEDKLRAARTSTEEEENKDNVSKDEEEIQEDSPISSSVLGQTEDQVPASSQSQRSSTTTSASAEASEDDESVTDKGHVASSGILDSSFENTVTLELQTDDFLLDGGCEVVSEEQSSLLEEVLNSLKGPLASRLVLESEATVNQMEVEDAAGEDVVENLDMDSATEHPDSTAPSSVLDDPLPVENTLLESATLLQVVENVLQEEEVAEGQEYVNEVPMEEDLQLRHEDIIEKEEHEVEEDQHERKDLTEDVTDVGEQMAFTDEEVVMEQEDEDTNMEEYMTKEENHETEDAEKEGDQEEEMLVQDNKEDKDGVELTEEEEEDENETKCQSCPLEDEEQEIKLDPSITIESYHETNQSVDVSADVSGELVNQPEDLLAQVQPSFVVMTSLELSCPKTTSKLSKQTEDVPEILQEDTDDQHDILQECEDQSTESLQIDNEYQEEVHQEEVQFETYQSSTSENEAAEESIHELSFSATDDEPVFNRSLSRDQPSDSMRAVPAVSQSLPSSPLQRDAHQADENTTPENPFGVRLRKTPGLHRYTSEVESPTSNTETMETQKPPFLEQLSRKPGLPQKPDQVADGVVKPKRTTDLPGKVSMESSDTPSWISLARQKQKVFKENSLDESSESKFSTQEEFNKKGVVDDLSGTRDQLKPVASPVKLSCSLEISKPVLMEKEKRTVSHPIPAPLTQDEPPWLALAKKKAKAWSEMPQIVQ